MLQRDQHASCLHPGGWACSRDGLQMWLGFEFCHQMHCCKLQNFESIKFNKYLQYPEARPQQFDRVYIASFQIHTISIFWYFILFHSHCRGHTPCRSMQDTIGSDRPHLNCKCVPSKGYKPVLTEEAPTSPDGHSVTWPQRFWRLSFDVFCLVYIVW